MQREASSFAGRIACLVELSFHCPFGSRHMRSGRVYSIPYCIIWPWCPCGGQQKDGTLDENGQDKKHGASPEKRARLRCCYCDCGTEGHTRIPLEEDDFCLEFGTGRCRCSRCGPTLPGGERQCVVDLNVGGVAVSRSMDGRVICFECRGFE